MDMKLTVYGSFNCPYSFLASLRVERLSRLGVADVEWRAIVLDRGVLSGGLPVAGKLATVLDGAREPRSPIVRVNPCCAQCFSSIESK
jgi:2-hydroxychromene-2-carboxylate isomerase